MLLWITCLGSFGYRWKWAGWGPPVLVILLWHPRPRNWPHRYRGLQFLTLGAWGSIALGSGCAGWRLISLGFNHHWAAALGSFWKPYLQQQQQTAVNSSRHLPLVLWFLDGCSPSPLLLFSGIFTWPCFSAFSLTVSMSITPLCLSASSAHPLCLGHSLEFFSSSLVVLYCHGDGDCCHHQSSNCFWHCLCLCYHPELLRLLLCYQLSSVFQR